MVVCFFLFKFNVCIKLFSNILLLKIQTKLEVCGLDKIKKIYLINQLIFLNFRFPSVLNIKN